MEIVKPHKGWSLLSADYIEHTNADCFQNFILYKPRLEHLKMPEEKGVLMMIQAKGSGLWDFHPSSYTKRVSLFSLQESTKLIIFLKKTPTNQHYKRNMQRKKTIYKKYN